eukprot:Nk52_evm25s2531 gene=Nk52_evmTU25s2531
MAFQGMSVRALLGVFLVLVCGMSRGVGEVNCSVETSGRNSPDLGITVGSSTDSTSLYVYVGAIPGTTVDVPGLFQNIKLILIGANGTTEVTSSVSSGTPSTGTSLLTFTTPKSPHCRGYRLSFTRTDVGTNECLPDKLCQSFYASYESATHSCEKGLFSVYESSDEPSDKEKWWASLGDAVCFIAYMLIAFQYYYYGIRELSSIPLLKTVLWFYIFFTVLCAFQHMVSSWMIVLQTWGLLVLFRFSTAVISLWISILLVEKLPQLISIPFTIRTLEQDTVAMEKTVLEATSDLRAQCEKIEKLVFDFLPPEISQQIKEGYEPQPQVFDQVSFCFTDIKNFTIFCSQRSPVEVQQMLDACFTQYDTLLEKYCCHKLETIGDAYIVLSGAPSHNNYQATCVALFAEEMLKALKNVIQNSDGSAFSIIKKSTASMSSPVSKSSVASYLSVLSTVSADETVSIRVGIHCGPALGTVLGKTKISYAMFGQTVVEAEGLEQTGIAGKIHCSVALKDALEKEEEDAQADEDDPHSRFAKHLKYIFAPALNESSEQSPFPSQGTYFVNIAHIEP